MHNPQMWRADYATWASTDSDIHNESCKQTPVNTEEWLHMLLYREKKGIPKLSWKFYYQHKEKKLGTGGW